jgi:hypothetical protein
MVFTLYINSKPDRSTKPLRVQNPYKVQGVLSNVTSSAVVLTPSAVAMQQRCRLPYRDQSSDKTKRPGIIFQDSKIMINRSTFLFLISSCGRSIMVYGEASISSSLHFSFSPLISCFITYVL